MNPYVHTQQMCHKFLSKKGNLLFPIRGSCRSSDMGHWPEGKSQKPGVQGEVFSRGFLFGSSINLPMRGKQTVLGTSGV